MINCAVKSSLAALHTLATRCSVILGFLVLLDKDCASVNAYTGCGWVGDVSEKGTDRGKNKSGMKETWQIVVSK